MGAATVPRGTPRGSDGNMEDGFLASEKDHTLEEPSVMRATRRERSERRGGSTR